MKKMNIALVSSSLYIAFQLFANILSTKIALLPWLNLAIDGGTVIYPFTFTLRDFVHKTWGKKSARTVVLLAAGLNIVMAGLFWLIGIMQPDPNWTNQEAYNLILLPVWRITFASIIAQVVSELLDTEIFSSMYKKFGDVWGVLISNTVSLLVDSILFSLIAFVGTLPMDVVIQIILTNIVIKLIISILSVPTIKLIPVLVKEEEI